MVVIDVCRDDISGRAVTWLKVGTANVEVENERVSVTNFAVGIETPPVQLDEQALREKLGSFVSTPELLSEVMVAVRHLVMSAARSNVPTLRVRSPSDRGGTPTVIPEEPPTAVSSTLKT
jgi:hypothetical protein